MSLLAVKAVLFSSMPSSPFSSIVLVISGHEQYRACDIVRSRIKFLDLFVEFFLLLLKLSISIQLMLSPRSGFCVEFCSVFTGKAATDVFTQNATVYSTRPSVVFLATTYFPTHV